MARSRELVVIALIALTSAAERHPSGGGGGSARAPARRDGGGGGGGGSGRHQAGAAAAAGKRPPAHPSGRTWSSSHPARGAHPPHPSHGSSAAARGRGGRGEPRAAPAGAHRPVATGAHGLGAQGAAQTRISVDAGGPGRPLRLGTGLLTHDAGAVERYRALLEPLVFSMALLRWHVCPHVRELPYGLNASALDALVARAFEERGRAAIVDGATELRASLGVRLLGTCTQLPRGLSNDRASAALIDDDERFNTRRTHDWARLLAASVAYVHARGVRLAWMEVAARLDERVALSPAQYTHLLTVVRRELDARELDVGIAGPGVGAPFVGRYVDSFDEDALDALGAWSFYVWDTLKPTALSSLEALDALVSPTVQRLRALDLSNPRPVLSAKFGVRTAGGHTMQGSCYANVSGSATFSEAVRNRHAYGIRLLAVQLLTVNAGVDSALYASLADRQPELGCLGLHDRLDGAKAWAAPLLRLWSVLPPNAVALQREWKDSELVVGAFTSADRSVLIIAAVNTHALAHAPLGLTAALAHARLVSTDLYRSDGAGATVLAGKRERVVTVSTSEADRRSRRAMSLNVSLPPLSALILVLRPPVDEASMKNYSAGGAEHTLRSTRRAIPHASTADARKSAAAVGGLIAALALVCYCAREPEQEAAWGKAVGSRRPSSAAGPSASAASPAAYTRVPATAAAD